MVPGPLPPRVLCPRKTRTFDGFRRSTNVYAVVTQSDEHCRRTSGVVVHGTDNIWRFCADDGRLKRALGVLWIETASARETSPLPPVLCRRLAPLERPNTLFYFDRDNDDGRNPCAQIKFKTIERRVPSTLGRFYCVARSVFTIINGRRFDRS